MGKSIKDVAKEAGVSIATVSRALNNKSYVSQESYDKVVAAAKLLNYEPNYFAKSLLQQKSNIIGVLVSDIDTSFFSKILKSIERFASQNDYHIMICNIEENLEKEKKYLTIFQQMQVDGIILTHERIDEELLTQLNKISGTPIIACSCKIDGLNCSSVNIDDYQASYDAVAYLKQLGHTKIAYFGSNLNEQTVGKKRYAGVIDSIKNNNCYMPTKYVKLSTLKLEQGYTMMKDLLESCKDDLPTAIFAASDEVAVGAMNCLVDTGYKVPEHMSIIGFDNSDISTFVRPTITTVHQPIEEIGAFSVSVLIDLIEKKTNKQKDYFFPYKIIERGSCAKLL